MKKLLIIGMLFSAPAYAADLTLNDLPTVLGVLRECTISTTFMGSKTKSCKLTDGKVWASVDADGEITIFYRNGGIEITASGSNLNEAVQVLSVKLNNGRNVVKNGLEALAPYLATQ